MATVREWLDGQSSRDSQYKYCIGKHVGLIELREDFPKHQYLSKDNIPCYPKYVFKEPNVCHVTEMEGFQGILKDTGFRGGDHDRLLWWSLSLSDDSMKEKPFTKEFAASPAFQPKSRYGNFRFTFQLTELLKQYSMQFCGRTSPILRVFETQFYKQEIVYCVLVHPRYMTHYRKYPRLPLNTEHKERLCGYSEKAMKWRCQSPSDNYEYGLETDDAEYPSKLDSPKYFVWDKVAVAFHMKKNWVLEFEGRCLLDHLSLCKVAPRNLLKNRKEPISVAEAEVKKQKNKLTAQALIQMTCLCLYLLIMKVLKISVICSTFIEGVFSVSTVILG